ncbi:MAG: hypothetical protein ACI4AQ_01250 [Lachnospiraceae bacterium]
MACGGSSEPAATPTKSAANEVTTQAPAPAATEAETTATEAEDFTLLDVSADLVDAAIYSIDETGTEFVITLFRDPSGNNYISLMSVDANGKGDVVCGPYDETNISTLQTDDGVDWTGFDVVDVYTGDTFSVIFAEGDDGSVAVTNVDFSIIMEGEYLTADQAIEYMAAAISFLE